MIRVFIRRHKYIRISTIHATAAGIQWNNSLLVIQQKISIRKRIHTVFCNIFSSKLALWEKYAIIKSNYFH